MYCGYVVQVNELRPHTNADKLQIATFFGNDVCVGLNVALGDLGVYFPTDGQLSVEFCREHDLVRRKDENGNAAGGYLDPNKRNVKTIRLRGEASDGLYMPLSCLNYCYDGVPAMCALSVGDTISVVNGHDICQKYIPTPTSNSHRAYGNKVKKRKVNVAPTFFEHEDTSQLAYNLADFRPGDLVELTLKMHGTSQRTGYVPVFQRYSDSWACKVGNAFRHILNKISGKESYEDKHDGDPIYEYDYVTGTRRVVLDDFNGGFYGSNAFREQHAEKFRGKLHKGETVYYEVVGFTDTGAPIMGNANNKKINDKEFIKMYGEETVFSYGCASDGVKFYNKVAEDLSKKLNEHTSENIYPQSDLYVYRMTMTNEDGDVVEYTPNFMRYRCEQMGIKTVPVFAKFIIPEFYQLPDNVGSPQEVDAGEYVRKIAEDFYDGPDPIGKTHIREGVVARIINRPKFTAYKHKNLNFKILEGIVKESAAAPDMEEAQEVESK